MNFALGKKYSEINFEEVGPSDVSVIGGGCGGGGGSTTITSASVQIAAQSAASSPGANSNVGNISIGDPVQSHDLVVRWTANTPDGGVDRGTAWINTSTGTVVSSVVMHSGPSSGGFWASVGNFFSWMFGSH